MKLIIVSLVLTLNKYLNVTKNHCNNVLNISDRTNSRPGIRTMEKNRTKMLENFFKVNEKKKKKETTFNQTTACSKSTSKDIKTIQLPGIIGKSA